ncbi:UPF0118 membrane protein YdbI [Porphyridium purpureum]|uniref:UPF0118 membrane protein YdbI n=1 Tax=Porphyridium purpureum TaxID=35688 RepID=A0A5J4Z5A5_PORPP|nr:UPF0118 membrane protein YdbI [Porphyridium purpureum]|eukprot:POR7552..scf295_1
MAAAAAAAVRAAPLNAETSRRRRAERATAFVLGSAALHAVATQRLVSLRTVELRGAVRGRGERTRRAGIRTTGAGALHHQDNGLRVQGRKETRKLWLAGSNQEPSEEQSNDVPALNTGSAAVPKISASGINLQSQGAQVVQAGLGNAALFGVPLQKALIWAVMLAILYTLRPFYAVLLGTFVLAYLAESMVGWASTLSRGRVPRRAIVSSFYAFIITMFMILSLVTVPRAFREGRDVVVRLQDANPYVMVANGIRSSIGDQWSEKLETFLILSVESSESADTLSDSTKEILEQIPSSFERPSGGLLPSPFSKARQSPAPPAPASPQQQLAREPVLQQEVGWTEGRSQRLGVLLQKVFGNNVRRGTKLITTILRAAGGFIYKFVASLIFSFMVLWDLPNLKRAAKRLRRGRLASVYEEVVPVLADVSNVLGKAFEAQSMIALVNTVLTVAGLLILRIPGVFFLSTLTLVCSFVPVAGVIISTVPMAYIALVEYGVRKALSVMLMVVLVHTVEANTIAPLIFSTHLKLHPLLVLAVLFVADHFFGITGLLLGAPIAVYVLRLLQANDDDDSEEAEGNTEQTALVEGTAPSQT